MLAAAARTGPDVGTYVLLMVIADETDEAANAKWRRYNDGADTAAVRAPLARLAGWPQIILSYRRRPVSKAEVGPGLRREDEEDDAGVSGGGGLSYWRCQVRQL
jgi:alkanesulfonate monooxygenase SsuD/methylene tetrahydromethanopterin reductase-like flavin-dependent oxidoreductase (luciferase family)